MSKTDDHVESIPTDNETDDEIKAYLTDLEEDEESIVYDSASFVSGPYRSERCTMPEQILDFEYPLGVVRDERISKPINLNQIELNLHGRFKSSKDHIFYFVILNFP